MEEQNIDEVLDTSIVQSSIVVDEGSRNGDEILASQDELNTDTENAVDGREDDFDGSEGERKRTENRNEGEEDYADVLSLASVKASEYCLLCRARFPFFEFSNQPNHDLYYKWRSENPDEPWQSQVRAVVRISRNQRDCIAVTEVIELKGRYTIKAPLVGWPPSISIDIEPAHLLDYYIDNFSSCLHDWCYSIFSWKFGPDKLELLYRMATSLQPSTAWEMPSDISGPLYPHIDCDTLLSSFNNTSAKFQPFFLAKLPPELRSRIWNLVGPTSAYSAFIFVTGETSTLAHHTATPAIRELVIKPGYYVESSTINMYGTQYLQSLDVRRKSCCGIEVGGALTQIQVISSVHGICSIRLLGSDWKSKWLGAFPQRGRCWYGTIPVNNDDLICFYNGLTIEEVALSHRPIMRQIMWDRLDHPELPFDADSALFTLFEPEELYQKRLPSLGFFRFVSLTLHETYASGLTVHFLSKCITGIEAHFSTTSHLVGSCGDLALHFPLAPHERISNVWLRLDTLGAVESVPSLLIRTTLGRDHTFGPYIGPTRYPNYRWIMLKQIGCVAGFYFENSPQVRRLGVIGDGKIAKFEEVPLPFYETCDPTPPYIGSLGRDLFMNDAKIQDLKSVIACTVGHRCIGMLLHYIDTALPAVVLGQWLDSARSKHVCIYDIYEWGKTPPLKIVFKLSKPGVFVQEVFFSSGDNLDMIIQEHVDSDSVAFEIYPFGTRITWWFTGELDSIRIWKPRFDQSSRIPIEETNSKTQSACKIVEHLK
ncbi:hypothetical protein EYC80_006909 [Monilinia laxa]|uniref:Uncharacterized protein n=1 Tax=Monilinia laxa TaxID=61186 RepID=A0A5N6JZI8_MONLA|nr:hypothetical protein EYC80_006909 [Monilinia laxa]